MKKNNRTCPLCRKSYTYCPSCNSFNKYPIWMETFCSENCMNVYYAYAEYITYKDIARAKAMLEGCDLSDVLTYGKAVQGVLSLLTADEAKTEPVIQEVEEISEVVIQPKAYRKKSKYKKSED